MTASLPSPAGAAPRPLNETNVQPAPGQIAAQPGYLGSQTFSLDTPEKVTSLAVEIASQNIPGQDGTLADDYGILAPAPAS